MSRCRVKNPTSEVKTWVTFWHFPHLSGVALVGGAHKQTSHTEDDVQQNEEGKEKKKNTLPAHMVVVKQANSQAVCVWVKSPEKNRCLANKALITFYL